MFPGFILRSNSCLKNRRIVNIICSLVLYLFGLYFIRSFTLMQKNQNIKARKLAPTIFPGMLKQLLFFNENNSTILNVCIPLAINTDMKPKIFFALSCYAITLVIYVILCRLKGYVTMRFMYSVTLKRSVAYREVV